MSGTFALDLKAFAEKAGKKADAAVHNVVLRISESLDKYSPVGDPTRWKHPEAAPPGYVGGHFRGNWQLGTDTVPVGEIAGVDPRGDAARGRIKASIPQESAGHIYWFANNVPYAIPLEYGHSSQAVGPGGVVGRTVSNFQQIVRAAVEAMP